MIIVTLIYIQIICIPENYSVKCDTEPKNLFQASAGVSRAFLTPYSNRLSINKNKFIYSVDRPQLETGQNLTAIFVLLCYHMHPC